jgi:spectrin alpha
MEIDARANTFQQFDDYASELILNSHFMSDDIRHKVNEIKKFRDNLESAYKKRKEKLDKCLELQLFIRDCEAQEQWMSNRENALLQDQKAGGANKGGVEAAIKRHEDFDRAINAQEEKISNLQIFADTLISGEHYDKDGIANRINNVIDRWQKLHKALIDHRSKLGESQTLQDFSRDADEIEALIMEKSQQLAADEAFNDLSNLQVRIVSSFFFVFGYKSHFY